MRDEILSFVNECVLFNNFDELKKEKWHNNRRYSKKV